VLPRDLHIDDAVAGAQAAEQAGLDEVWVVEDCFFGGGVATAAIVLEATSRITVGIGILPAVTRNAAFTAMELATLANRHPGRLAAGLGHGMSGWMRQIGALPASPLTALAETLDVVALLLAGETVTVDGRYVKLDAVRLDAPPSSAPPLFAGVRGPKSLELSGRFADGTILAEPASAQYIRDARRIIGIGQALADRHQHHRIVAYNIFASDDDGAAARTTARKTVVSAMGPHALAHIAPLWFGAELAAHIAAARPVTDIPDSWLGELAIAGTPSHCAATIAALGEAGADSCVLLPPEDAQLTDVVAQAAVVRTLVHQG
jgi:alkanesulfonate monooxygenase SsuD/methylene tetrahydromethanopterin reductase-like flavin-dependent oxidoreductase (luciferase family)